MIVSHSTKLRFSALLRVSTEKQEKRGESLLTQASQVEQAVASLGGTLVKRYAGQEHATEGYERQLLDRLLADAQKQPRAFDAVIVADATRWSRDNVKSDTGLEILRDAGVKFFVLSTEYDLHNAEARLFLRMTATIGAYHAHTQKEKSLKNRIARARRGIPTVARLPYGRLWDKKSQTWSVDEDKQAFIQEIAQRYLQGEGLPQLAGLLGTGSSNLIRILRGAGPTWELSFVDAALNIDEQVTLSVPPLLDEKTRRAIEARLAANRTNLHGRPQHPYLLAGYLFCQECGFSLIGEHYQRGARQAAYYRHSHNEGGRACSLRPRPWVPAAGIEQQVLYQLVLLTGNPALIERSVYAAVPDRQQEQARDEQLVAELGKVQRGRDRILDMISKDLLTAAEAEHKLRELKERQTLLTQEREKLAEALAEAPTPQEIQRYVKRIDGQIRIEDDEGNLYLGGNDLLSRRLMSWDDKRKLVQCVFGQALPDGRSAGVYVRPVGEGRKYRPHEYVWTMKGRLDFEVVLQNLDGWQAAGLPGSNSCSRSLRTPRGVAIAVRAETLAAARRRSLP
jgi:DNA invertase Pin-like site-specific DNA recombinase